MYRYQILEKDITLIKNNQFSFCSFPHSSLFCIGVLKLDISPPGDKPPYCLTSELQQVRMEADIFQRTNYTKRKHKGL